MEKINTFLFILDKTAKIKKKDKNEYTNRNSDYIYFYRLDTLIEINESNEVHTYYMPLPIRERASIKKEIK